MPGWTQQGAARSYIADNLFEYMDGNAEGYLLYGFQTMHGVTCEQGGDHPGDRHFRFRRRRFGLRHVHAPIAIPASRR